MLTARVWTAGDVMVDRTVLTTRMNISVVMYITSVDGQLKIHSFTIILLYNTITVLSRVDVYILCSISFGGGGSN